MNRLITFLLSILLLTSCTSPMEKLKEEDPVQYFIVEEASLHTEKYGLELVALNIPQDCQKGYFYLHFLSCREMEIDEVRSVVVDVVESFLANVNESDLFPSSVSIKDIIFNFGFVQDDGNFHEPPSVAYAYVKNEEVHYCYYDNIFGKFISYDDVKEPYQKAKELALR